MISRKHIKIMAEIVILVFGVIYIWNTAPYSMIWTGLKTKFVNATKNIDSQEGDFIFQNIHGEIFRVIQDVTGNPITHCGIIVKKDNKFFVLEAIGPVKLTPLNAWIHRGIGSQFTIARLKRYFRNQIPHIIESAYHYLNRPYDIQYEWDDKKIYCSELIYKAVRDATGLRLTEFRRLGDMNWKPHETFIRKISGGKLPLENMMIIPGDLAKSEMVETVYSNFKDK